MAESAAAGESQVHTSHKGESQARKSRTRLQVSRRDVDDKYERSRDGILPARRRRQDSARNGELPGRFQLAHNFVSTFLVSRRFASDVG